MTYLKGEYRVLVMGYRQGLCRALSRRGISHAVWSEKAIKVPGDFLHAYVGKFPRGHDRIREILAGFDGCGPFTHVIAGTEASVYAAAVARRILKTRLSTQSVALRCHDKLHMKSYLYEHGVPMTTFLAGDEIHDAADTIRRLGVPVVIKMRHESGGRGIRLAETAEEIIRYSGRNKIMERFIAAPEASVESFINNGKILFESVTQYYVKKHINIVPGLVSLQQRQALLELNRQVIGALKIKWGITHMETYLGDDGVLFGEIALRPPGGYIMELISRAYGFSAWDALVHIELDMPFDFPQGGGCYTAAYIVHPGAGKIAQINGWDEVSTLPSVFKSRLKITTSSTMNERQGVGEDAGYLLLSCGSGDELLRDLDHIDSRLEFVMA